MHEKIIEERMFHIDFGNFHIKIYQIPSPLRLPPEPLGDDLEWVRVETSLFHRPEEAWERYHSVFYVPRNPSLSNPTFKDALTYILCLTKDRILDEFSGQLRAGLMI